MISSLFFQEKRAEAYSELKEIIEYYKSINITLNSFRISIYLELEEFINKNKKLKENDKKLLLTLISIIKSPSRKKTKTLKEFIEMVYDMFKEYVKK
jgi:hypothetical protein